MPTSTASALSPSHRGRVLIVDGDADTREMYRQLFAECGWAVAEASDGREALVHAVSEQPSIVVTELRLAFIDGIALCRLLRHDWMTRNVPILVVTSETRPSSLKEAERAGATAVLIKPSTPNAVIAEMERLTQVATVPTANPQSPERHSSLSKAHQRFETTTPNEPAPPLVCPICTQTLVYQKTFFGGVSRRHPERWDYLKCAQCGEFSYRHRTRRLQHLA